MVDTALGLSPAQWSAIGAFIGFISLLYVIWWNYRRDKERDQLVPGKSKSKGGKKKVESDILTDISRKKIARLESKAERKRLKARERELKKISKSKVNVIEDECLITQRDSHLKSLGELSGGDAVESEFIGTLGGNFSYYLMDDSNKDHYIKKGEMKNPIKQGKDKKKFKFKVTIPHSGKYYVLFTTRATKNPRNVHYTITIYKSK